jgi:predicted aspartyl protease
MPRLSLTTLIALLASLSACASPMDGAPRTAQEECVFGAGDVSPLRGPTGMVVAGSVNGEPATLEVSTGLGLTSVLPGSVQALGLPTDPVRRSGFGGRGPDDVRQNVRVRSLRVGGQDWTDRSVAVRPFFMPDGSPPAFDAMIGANLLRETELEVDLPARRVAFHPRRNCRPGAPPWAPASSVPMDMQNHGSPVIVARVNGHAVRALIHSGNNATVMTRRLADRLDLVRADAAGRRVRSHGTHPGVSRGQEFRVDELAVGEEVLRNVPVVVTADGTGGQEELVLGQDWLRHRKVWLSFGGRRVFLARAGE